MSKNLTSERSVFVWTICALSAVLSLRVATLQFCNYRTSFLGAGTTLHTDNKFSWGDVVWGGGVGLTVGSDIGCWLIFSWSSAIGALFSTASPVNCALVAREDKKSCNFRKRDLGKRFHQDLKVQRSSNGSFGGYWVCCFGSRNPFRSFLLYTWWQRENYRYWSSHQ
jgi:hypothetical protein